MMRSKAPQVKVTCCNCGGKFPVSVTPKPDEPAAAEPEQGEAEETVERACWCPWCQTANVAAIPVKLAPKTRTFRPLVRSVQGMPEKGDDQS